MDPATFAKVLERSCPSDASLSTIGIEGAGIVSIRSGFELHPRLGRQSYELPDAALNRLFSNFNPSSVEVGPVRFDDAPRPITDGWIVGDVAGDYLVLQRADGEINVRDIAAPAHVMWPCAQNGSMLLDALALAVEYLTPLMFNRRQPGSAEACAVECGKLSGGQKYQQFYEMVLGVE